MCSVCKLWSCVFMLVLWRCIWLMPQFMSLYFWFNCFGLLLIWVGRALLTAAAATWRRRTSWSRGTTPGSRRGWTTCGRSCLAPPSCSATCTRRWCRSSPIPADTVMMTSFRFPLFFLALYFSEQWSNWHWIVPEHWIAYSASWWPCTILAYAVFYTSSLLCRIIVSCQARCLIITFITHLSIYCVAWIESEKYF